MEIIGKQIATTFFVYVWFFLMLIQDDAHSLSIQSWNWFEEQQRCKIYNDTLQTTALMTSEEEYWTGVYTRYSLLIKILGCYSVGIVEQIENQKFSMKYPSAGFCQEICGSIGFLSFGIKAKECVCLKRTVTAGARPISQCNETCEEPTEGISFAQCGGRNVYTLYMLYNSEGTEPKQACVAIECSTTIGFSIPQNCYEPKFGACRDRDTQTKQSWVESMKRCKALSPPSYLVGNIKTYDASAACAQLNRTQNESSWIGAANEMYMGYDRGVLFETSERPSFHQCQKCNRSTCEFTQCSDRLYALHCEKGSQVEVSTQEETDNKNSENEDSSSSLTIIMLSVFVLITVGCLALAVTCCLHKKNERQKVKKRQPDSANPNDQQYQYIDDDQVASMNYSVRRFTSKTLTESANKTQVFDNTYMETTEGTYDCLRNKDVQKNKNENTYDHVHSSTQQQYMYEGCGVNIKENNQHIEATYDHASPFSDYGKCIIQADQMNEDYSKTSFTSDYASLKN